MPVELYALMNAQASLTFPGEHDVCVSKTNTHKYCYNAYVIHQMKPK